MKSAVEILKNLDETDKEIMRHVCSGTHSYSELAELVGVSRNTVYRRLNKLEEEGFLKKRAMAIPDFEKIGFSSIIICLNVGIGNLEKAVSFLKKQNQVKFLWKTYGEYEIVAFLLCDKEDVGICINNLKKALHKLNIEVGNFVASPSMSWEKMEFVP